MAILVDDQTRVICQGITGQQASFYCQRAIDSGTCMVGGVNPKKGGQQHLGLPVFSTVSEAKRETAASASMIMVPPAAAGKALLEAIEAELPLVVCITERIPVLDMLRVKAALAGSDTVLIGPNCPGIVTPGACQIGIMPSEIFSPGSVGIISRSSTLTYEAIAQSTRVGLGQSTCIGIGADPVHGISYVEALGLFLRDDETDAVVLIGEIGGTAEEEAAAFLKSEGTDKVVVSYIAGMHAPAGKRMGHAGAIQQGISGTALQKREYLARAGSLIASTPDDIGSLLEQALALPDT